MSDDLLACSLASTSFAIGAIRSLDKTVPAAVLMYNFNTHVGFQFPGLGLERYCWEVLELRLT